MLRTSLLALAALSGAALSTAQDISWWKGDLDGALAAAGDSESGTLLLYLFGATDETCKAMYNSTMADKAVVQALGDYVCMASDREIAASKPVFDRFRIHRVPTVLIIRPDGTVEDSVVGYFDPKPFLDELARIRKGEDTVGAMRDAAKAKPKDLELQLRLARKLRDIGQLEEAAGLLEAVVAADPRLRKEAAAEARLIQILDQTFPPGTAPQDADLDALHEYLIEQKNKRVRFLGYDRVATCEFDRGNLVEAMAAAAKAWKYVPEEEVLDWGHGTAARIYAQRKQLEDRDLKLGLEMTSDVLEAAEKVHAERGDAFLANVLWLHGCLLNANNKRKQAFATLEQAIALAPDNEDIKGTLDAFKRGEK